MRYLLLLACALLFGCAQHSIIHHHWIQYEKANEATAPEASRPDSNEVILPLDAPKWTLYFDFDSRALKDTAKAAQVAAYAHNSGAAMVLAGHASPEGAAEYNLALGAHRAEAVKQYLVAYGIPADRIRCISYGAEQLATLEPTEYWRDRRVEVSIEGVSP